MLKCDERTPDERRTNGWTHRREGGNSGLDRRLINTYNFYSFSVTDWTRKPVMKKFALKWRRLLTDPWRAFWSTLKTKLSPLTLLVTLIPQFSMLKLVSCSQAPSSNSSPGNFFTYLYENWSRILNMLNYIWVFLYTVSAQLEAHSWIEPHPLEKLIQAQSKTDIETIQAQLEYSPSQKINQICILKSTLSAKNKLKML